MTTSYHYLPKAKQSGECYFSDDLSREWTAESVDVVNATNEWIVLPPGYPMIAGVPATKDNVATADGFIIGGRAGFNPDENENIIPNYTQKVGVFRDGKGIAVNRELLPDKDLSGNSFDETYQARMESLNFVLKNADALCFCGSC